MRPNIVLIILLIILTAGMVNAEEEQKNLSGSGEVGLLMTSGNSETDSVNAKSRFKIRKRAFSRRNKPGRPLQF